jgi:hypothetical protein
MSDGRSLKKTFFEIRVKGRLDPLWENWFEGFSVRYEGEEVTILCGPVPDQAFLHGILERIRDLNLHLLSVAEKPEGCP